MSLSMTLPGGLPGGLPKQGVIEQHLLSPASAESLTPRMEEFAEPSSSAPIEILAQNMTALVKKIQDLRHIGIEDSQITLPKICVIGGQSTGKSSLIEGMSEIKVPRSAGTCTRCPMEINLSEGEPGQPWTCRVYLSRKYFFNGSHKISKPKKSDPLGPWHKQDQEDELFITITDKAKIEDAIKWAQIAILNPSNPTASYIPHENKELDDSHCQVKFSPNIVRLDISAANFPSLSFYDLPGVINQAECDEERYLVNLVENLVKEYICQENCIVLLTMTMTDDVMNSSAARILRDVRGAKHRALGVLTKPDRVQTGESYNQWIEILEGDKFTLGHGYYVVRNNPNPSIEHSVARQEEDEFFSSPPWVTELSTYHQRFGTRHLQTALSHLLFQQIQGSLPLIIDKINEKAARIDAELATLPAPPSANVPYILCGKLHTLKDRIRYQIDGGDRKYPLQKLWNRIAEDFKRALRMTRPTVKLLADWDKQIISVDRNDDSECELTRVQCSEHSAKRKLPENSADSVPSGPASKAKKPSGYHSPHFDAFNSSAKVFSWEEIRDINKESASAGIPQQINPKALDCMDQMSVVHWLNPMMVFIESSHRLVKDTLLRELREVFVQYLQTRLFRELKRIIEGYLNKLRAEHVDHVNEIYSIEYHKPFTMANEALGNETEIALQHIKSRRFYARANHYLTLQQKYPVGDPHREREMKRLGPNELGSDPFTLEVEMMATTRGYYEVASSRLVDSVCQSVHTKLFFKCHETLIEAIEDGLGIQDENAVERCNELMCEDADRQHRRQYLEKQKEKVMKAQEWLNAENTTDNQGNEPTDFGREIKSQPPDNW
ncbi:P-loop containing nucleoside triphosphate hydrolase protein [Aspergillus cavernicola]|uniref:P-loop containing nucleoside triphosphate hydrolase protein n=1 Tax=Aspergillus cavernicola TaxID=176166 RepID=A0ABR4J5I3_9EURO